MTDYVEIGATPCDEDCLQVGSPEYTLEGAYAECERFLVLIRKKLGPEPQGARLMVKRFFHDFGQYFEVVCKYDDRYEEAVDYAFKCESDAPTKWEE